jgi:hypothetical protein
MLSLPAEGEDVSSPQLGGLALIAGRWAIRTCEARSDGQTVWLRLGGLGWLWVDRSGSGFRVQQYVFFAASIDLRGQLDVAYDPAAHVASVWLTPVDDVNAHVEALGNINARPEGLGASVLGLVLPLVGMTPDNIARARAGTEGAQRFRERLRAGMTATYDTGRQQLDMVLGQLPNGLAPARPFSSGSLPWLVNERVLLMPGGFQLLGPFDSGGSPALLSARVEQGSGVSYRALCEADVWNALDAAARGSPVTPLAGTGSALLQAGYAAEVPVQRPPCRWLLAVSSAGPTPVVGALHMRASGPTSGNGAGSAWVRLTLLGFEFKTTKPSGQPWDVGGGAPDPEFVIVANGRRYLLAAEKQDAFTGAPMTSSLPVEVSATAPLVIEAIDKDALEHDPMGSATVSLQQLTNGGELRVPVMLEGVQTGMLRVGVELRSGP